MLKIILITIINKINISEIKYGEVLSREQGTLFYSNKRS